jgi:hypothetical protein
MDGQQLPHGLTALIGLATEMGIRLRESRGGVEVSEAYTQETFRMAETLVSQLQPPEAYGVPEAYALAEIGMLLNSVSVVLAQREGERLSAPFGGGD